MSKEGKSIVKEKKMVAKSNKKLNKLIAGVNLGLQIEKDYIFWLYLKAEGGNFVLNRGKLDDYDFQLLAAPEDLMFFCNGENLLSLKAAALAISCIVLYRG